MELNLKRTREKAPKSEQVTSERARGQVNNTAPRMRRPVDKDDEKSRQGDKFADQKLRSLAQVEHNNETTTQETTWRTRTPGHKLALLPLDHGLALASDGFWLSFWWFSRLYFGV